MSDISKIKLPNGDIYNLKDNQALRQGDATIGAITGIVKQNSGLLTITDGAKNYPIEELKINFGPHQQGSGDPSLENVRTISGQTGLSVFVSPTLSGGTEYPVSWTDYGTIYGGMVDLVNGLLTVTYKRVKFRELPLGYNSLGYYYATVSDKANGIFNIVSEIYKNVNTGAAEMPDYSIRGTASNQNVFIMDKRYTNVNDLLTSVGDTYVAYEFATPIIYQLTPQQINTLLGENNIWTNIDSTISIKYAADTKLFIQQNTVKDVQINNTSINNNGVVNIPLASTTDIGVAKIGDTMSVNANGLLNFKAVGASEVKNGTSYTYALTPERQHASVFYGLAKAAGVDMKDSANAIGIYTNEAKTAIQQMIGLGTINASTVAATLDSTSKTYLLGTQSTITSTATNVSVSGDTGVYLTTNQGQISAAQHSINVNGTEKAYMTYNTTDQSIDFIFI